MAKYGDGSLEHLRGIKGIRKRPAMYIGATNGAGMTHAVGEVISNSVDQFLMGLATEIRVDIDAGGRTASVNDNGAGMPFDVTCTDAEMCLATKYLTEIHTTPTADHHVPHVHFLHTKGLHGVGIVALNAVSQKFVCRSWRNGRQWTQAFSCGVADSCAMVTAEGDGRGTEVCFTLDETIFGDSRIDLQALRSSLVDRVHLFSGLCIELNGERLFAERGLATMAESMCEQLPSNTTPMTYPTFHMNETYDDMIIHAAATGVADATKWRAWANSLLMPQGGTHQTAFSAAMSHFSWTPDVALIHVMMKDPAYTGSSIERLNEPKFEDIMRTRILEKLVEFCDKYSITSVREFESSSRTDDSTSTSC